MTAPDTHTASTARALSEAAFGPGDGGRLIKWRTAVMIGEQLVEAERAICAAIVREWIHGAPTTTTEDVLAAVAEQIETQP